MENPSWDCFIGRTGKPVCSAQAGTRGGLCVFARHDSQSGSSYAKTNTLTTRKSQIPKMAVGNFGVGNCSCRVRVTRTWLDDFCHCKKCTACGGTAAVFLHRREERRVSKGRCKKYVQVPGLAGEIKR